MTNEEIGMRLLWASALAELMTNPPPGVTAIAIVNEDDVVVMHATGTAKALCDLLAEAHEKLEDELGGY